VSSRDPQQTAPAAGTVGEEPRAEPRGCEEVTAGPSSGAQLRPSPGAALTWPLLLVRVSLADILVLVVCGVAFPGNRKGAVRKEKAQSPSPPTDVIRVHTGGQDQERLVTRGVSVLGTLVPPPVTWGLYRGQLR